MSHAPSSAYQLLKPKLIFHIIQTALYCWMNEFLTILDGTCLASTESQKKYRVISDTKSVLSSLQSFPIRKTYRYVQQIKSLLYNIFFWHLGPRVFLEISTVY